MESKEDALTNRLADFTLLMKQKTDITAVKDKDRTCSFCNDPGNSANRCEKNPLLQDKCERCIKLGHAMEGFWSRPKPTGETPPVAPAAVAPASVPVDISPHEGRNAQNFGFNQAYQAMIAKEGLEVVAAAK